MRRMVASATAALLMGGLLGGDAVADPVRRVASLSGDATFYEGDPNASGRAVLKLTPARRKICFRITFKKMRDPFFGSIHQEDGDLGVELFNGDRGTRSSPIKGCARDLNRKVIRKIARRPRNFLVHLTNHEYLHESAVAGRLKRPR